jgi:Zn-dependent peptidase ImmA (M78 family)/DNA-binding XRE family transcriptional regulator
MKYFSERLKHARKMNGFSLQDLSDSIGNVLSKQALSRFESGDSLPDSKMLNTLCKTLNVSPDYFFKEATVQLQHIEFRKLKKLPVKEQEKVTSRTVEYLERYLELEDLLGLPGAIDMNPRSFKITNTAEVEEAARRIRADWKLGDDSLFNITEMLEEHNIKVYKLDVDKSFSGMSTIVDNRVAVIVLNDNSEIPLVRKRFTALHELGHLYMDLSAYTEKEAEKICDAFAGAMLLPADKLKGYFGAKRTQVFTKELMMIAELYGISLSAIMYRALHLNIISPSYHKFFMINYNRYNTKAKEFDIYSGTEKSDRFLQLTIKAVADEVITTSKAAALNNQKLGDFREILDNTAK